MCGYVSVENDSMTMKHVEYVLFTYCTIVFIIYGCMFIIPQLYVHKPPLDDVYPLTRGMTRLSSRISV